MCSVTDTDLCDCAPPRAGMDAATVVAVALVSAAALGLSGGMFFVAFRRTQGGYTVVAPDDVGLPAHSDGSVNIN